MNILAEELELILMEKWDYVLNHIRDELNQSESDRRYDEKATVHSDGRIVFTFLDGTETEA